MREPVPDGGPSMVIPVCGYEPLNQALQAGQVTRYEDGSYSVFAPCKLTRNQYGQLCQVVEDRLGGWTFLMPGRSDCHTWECNGHHFSLKMNHKTHRGNISVNVYPNHQQA